MQTPYEILGIAVSASDNEIKQAYLQQVKINPPDRNQQQFQLIHDAFTAIKNHKSRVSYELFTFPVANFNTVIDKALQTEQQLVMNSESLNKILNSSIDASTLLNAIASPEK